MRRSLFAVLLLPALVPAADPPLLLQRPAVSGRQVAFVYAGDIWTVDRAGGDARRLTAGVGLESYPVFSPDGEQVAFAGDYEGSLDIYVVPAAGGVPRRLSHHPDPDVPVGWTPDGQAIVFRSARASYARFLRLFTVPATGGQPTDLPLPQAEDGALSPDGRRIAYVPLSNKPQFPGAFRPVRNYRGGSASPVWVADLADSAITKVPRTDSNDFNPMWVGDRVYFLSDRDGPTTLFAYDPAAKDVRRVLDPAAGDIKSAAACADAIVYDRSGTLHLFDLMAATSRPVPVRLTADLPGVRPKPEKVVKAIQAAGLSPTGTRAVFEARGEILTVPAEKEDARNLTNTPGTADRDQAWSPDGKSVAYFSDESGEYELCVRAQDGRGGVKKIKPGDGTPSFFYSPVWSPDNTKIAYADKRLNLWYADLDSGTSMKVDTAPYDDLPFPAVWSPDGKWLAYPRQLKNYLSAVFLYSLESVKARQVTDGMSDARHPALDKNGKHLYFTASTDIGPAVGSGMSVLNRPVTRSAYVVVLGKDDPSPLAPESDDEKEKKAAEKKEDTKDKDPPATRIDLDDLDQRTLALPIPPRNYVNLLAGKTGVLFLVAGPAVAQADGDGPPLRTIHRFDLDRRKTEKLVEATAVAVSGNGEKLLYQQKDDWFLVSSIAPPKPGEGALKLDGLEVRVDPRAEWRQVYREVYRIERNFLYNPGSHGYALKAAWDKAEPYLDGLGSRHDLNYLLDELLGGLSLQHVYLSGGDVPKAEGRKGGLLGADYAVENGRHRITKVYRGESWNPGLRAPLTQPGAGVKEGEYLLAVNGKDVRGEDEVYRLFEGTAGKQTTLKVGPNADGTRSREVTVVPVPNERALRNLAWVDANRRAVDRRTDGKVAYVYLPDTAAQGTPGSTGTSSPRPAGTGWSWTSGSTAAGCWPTT